MALKLDLRKGPFWAFERSLRRITILQSIEKDLVEHDATNLDSKVVYLNEVYVVYLVAHWQRFIKHLAIHGFQNVERIDSGPFRDIAKRNLDEAINRFNTPNKQNVDRLFRDTLGIPNVSSSWENGDLAKNMAADTLAEILKVRHEVAHTGRTEKLLSLNENERWAEILIKTAQASQLYVFDQLELLYESDI